MKKAIIILLILVGFIFGQKDQPSEKAIIQNSDNILNLYKHINELADLLLIAFDGIITSEMVLRYTEECYNDSVYKGQMYIIGESFYPDRSILTMVTATFRFDDETYYRDRPNEYIRIEEIYEPKIPTFQGFSEWCSERMKYYTKE